MELYSTLESILTAERPKDKITLFRSFYIRYHSDKLERDVKSVPRIFNAPSYAAYCEISDPKNVPRRNRLDTQRGQALLLHAIAHIEYSAIDLALDAVYRFREQGEEFEQDWLKVAEDEVNHFEMIETLLRECGSYYGEFSVHNALFEASMRTLTLLERMAIVPRYLEANGLDATPQILRKLNAYRDDVFVQRMIGALNVILEEEVDHVRKGDKWFEKACSGSEQKDNIYFDIVERYYPRSFPRKVEVNCTARTQAGFAKGELERIASNRC